MIAVNVLSAILSVFLFFGLYTSVIWSWMWVAVLSGTIYEPPHRLNGVLLNPP
jgi:hypothetical protein